MIVRKAATGQTWRTRHDEGTGRRTAFLPPTASRVHLTDGTPYSRTGRNLKALCGATVRPDEVPANHPAPVCPKCELSR